MSLGQRAPDGRPSCWLTGLAGGGGAPVRSPWNSVTTRAPDGPAKLSGQNHADRNQDASVSVEGYIMAVAVLCRAAAQPRCGSYAAGKVNHGRRISPASPVEVSGANWQPAKTPHA